MICPCGAHFCYLCGADDYDCEHAGKYDDEPDVFREYNASEAHLLEKRQP